MQTEDHTTGKVKQMLEDGHSRQEIIAALLDGGTPLQFATQIVDETIRLHHARNHTRGLYLALAGAILCLTSFALTFSGLFTGTAHDIVFYGLTSLGVLIVFYGFTFIF